METTDKTKSPQVEKYYRKLKAVDGSKPVFKKIFNFIDLTGVEKIAKEAKKTTTKTNTKFKSTITKEKNHVIPTIFDTTEIVAHDNSIRKYLNELHPDIQKFINKNEFKSIKGERHKLTVVTKNDFRIEITTTGRYKRNILIRDKKKNVLFKGDTEVKVTREEKAA